MFLSLLIISSLLPASASDDDAVIRALKKNYGEGADRMNIRAGSVRHAENWALVMFRMNTATGEVSWGDSALLHKDEKGKWVLNGFGGGHPTQDFLRMSGIPEKLHNRLIDKKILTLQFPLLKTLHRKYGRNYFFTSIKITGQWALGHWSCVEKGESIAEGQVLLKKKNSRWIILDFGGGAMDEGLLKARGVPPDVAGELFKQ